MPNDPSPPSNEPAAVHHARWTDGMGEARQRDEATPESTEPTVPQLPLPVIDLGSFQALIRFRDHAVTLADTVAAQAAELGYQHTANHAQQVRQDADALEQLARQLLPYTQAVSGDTGGHTPLDVHSFRRAGIDPAARQAREHSTPCIVCTEPTWNIAARCDLHYKTPHDADRALLTAGASA